MEVGSPESELTRNTVFSSDATANAAQLAIYSKMASSGYSYNSLSMFPGLSADELIDYEGSERSIPLYTNNLLPNSGPIDDIWSQAYEYIYAGNAILEGIGGAVGLSEAVKKQLNGEAKFARAFNYLYLTNLFGDVPLLLSTDYRKNAVAQRKSQTEVYDQIVKDLWEAEDSLSPDYVGADGTTISVERLRPCKAAATALLARVHLYLGDYEKAESYAASVIENPMFQLDESAALDQVFLNTSSEAIWQLSTGSSWGNTYEGFIYVLTSPPYQVALSSQLLSAFETGDKRKDNWIGMYTDGINSWYFPFKYKIQYDPSNPRENVMVLRLAEQYLIRAEARAQQGDLDGAQEDLNVIRNRAGLPNTTATDKASLLAAILHERQVELFLEWGHRWLDLKRTGKADEVMNTVTPQKGGTWQSFQKVYPIPQSNRLTNPNLSQNSGYN